MFRVRILSILILFLALQACVPSGGGKTKKKAASTESSESTDTDAPEEVTFTDGESLYWHLSSKVEGTLTINADITTVAFLKGQHIHDFLNLNTNYTKQFCLVASFYQNTSGALETFRMRAIPQNVQDLTTGIYERILRIDFPSKSDNTSLCSGSITPRSNLVSGATTALGAFSPLDICPTCSGNILSTALDLYLTTGSISDLNLVDQSTLDLSPVQLRVDMSNNTTSGNTGCTNSSCQALGLDCCLEGQCVTDGQIKSNPDATDLSQALSDVANNPSNFVNWPSVYNVCGSNSSNSSTPTPTPTPNAQATANANLEVMKGYFNCLEEGKKETPDFAGSAVCSPNNDQASFEAVRSTVWQICGCQSTPFPSQPDEPFCPDFGLKATKDNAGNITDVQCDIPTPDVDPTPVVISNYPLPARSAPHRFYDSNGINYDDLSEAQSFSPRPVVEGEEFNYLDEASKSGPLSTSFNMNSILGQMSLDLDRALPASVLNVTFDQLYHIRVNPSFYTPCPQCSPDAWFNAFKPYPTSSAGDGLAWSSYTTSRDSYENNITNGNYEDTIFGRACFVPPTMLAFSHQKDADLSTQRRNRLSTQAAMWTNGYQRDWYGFNQGAVIGSFDGVSWFAIGRNGRRVVATSKKLFLAINAPHADLASNTNISLSIIEDNGSTNLPEWDYSPELEDTDSLQNIAGSCRKWHQCKVDSDCVSQLGWEYVCAETGDLKSYWPTHDIDAKENANAEADAVTLSSMLRGFVSGGSTKRCVYRGAGSLCKVSYDSDFTATEESKKELFRCAPNFYCASMGSNDFSKEIQRTPANLTNILFGQGAPVLGRPITYIGGSADGQLTTEIQNNLKYNAAIYFGKDTNSAGANDFGLCRPGKRISVDDYASQHSQSDPNKRADYISQIGSCDSNATGSQRTRACPIFDEDGDYVTATTELIKRQTQNMCGQESKRDIGGGSFESTFANIEAERLSSLASLFSPQIVQDACLRKAGSVCHTDLDCSPNKFHKAEALLFDQTAFGDTEAEKSFWEENLICSQAAVRPLPNASDFNDYDVRLNRCCREIGSDITMFTQSDNENIVTNSTTQNSKLKVDIYPHDGATAEGRYSRYSVARATDSTPIDLTTGTVPYAQSPIVLDGATPKAYQWKTFNDTGKATCCGGGWIRRFSDGSHDWTNRTRVRIGVENFTCLNYQSKLNDTSEANPYGNPLFSNSNWLNEYDNLCLRPFNDGCLQRRIPSASTFEVMAPTLYTPGIVTLDTSPDRDPANNSLIQLLTLSTDKPYLPIPYPGNTTPIYSQDTLNFIADQSANGVSFYLPAYIAADVLSPTTGAGTAITAVSFRYFNDAGQEVAIVPANHSSVCAVAPNPKDGGLGLGQFCLVNDGSHVVFHAKANPAVNGGNWAYAGIMISFNPLNRTSAYSPGNDLYYLTKLARLELSGIPQIFFEPLYCNNDRDKLVPGIFDNVDDRAGFETLTSGRFLYDSTINVLDLTALYNATTSTDPSNTNKVVTYKEALSLPSVFSENDFTCCVELGNETTNASKCCTNFASTDAEGKRICKLPQGADLNVYFNRFVSGDGTGSEQPGGGLTDTDFNAMTGEPKLQQSTYNKLESLGSEYCVNGTTRRGAAFGFYFGQPNIGSFINEEGANIESQRIYSIVDSSLDNDTNNETGATPFLDGYRWDHHIYCR